MGQQNGQGLTDEQICKTRISEEKPDKKYKNRNTTKPNRTKKEIKSER